MITFILSICLVSIHFFIVLQYRLCHQRQTNTQILKVVTQCLMISMPFLNWANPKMVLIGLNKELQNRKQIINFDTKSLSLLLQTNNFVTNFKFGILLLQFAIYFTFRWNNSESFRRHLWKAMLRHASAYVSQFNVIEYLRFCFRTIILGEEWMLEQVD